MMKEEHGWKLYELFIYVPQSSENKTRHKLSALEMGHKNQLLRAFMAWS